MSLGIEDLVVFLVLVVFWLSLSLYRKGEGRYCLWTISGTAIGVLIGNIIYNWVF